jgi:hypothetical protein
MDLHEQYLEYKDRFSVYTDDELVQAFNRETGHNGWVGSRGAFLKALHEELRKRPMDISIIDSEQGMKLSHPVDLISGKLVRKEE